jgi:hypothetical protein
MPRGDPTHAVYDPEPPAEVLRDRDRRRSLDRDINMTLFGDPEPGRSALDRRNEALHR